MNYELAFFFSICFNVCMFYDDDDDDANTNHCRFACLLTNQTELKVICNLRNKFTQKNK